MGQEQRREHFWMRQASFLAAQQMQAQFQARAAAMEAKYYCRAASASENSTELVEGPDGVYRPKSTRPTVKDWVDADKALIKLLSHD